MFPLAGTSFPATAAQLASAIREALAQVMTLTAGTSSVTVIGEQFPTIDQLKVDLSGSTIRTSEPPPRPGTLRQREPGPFVRALEVVGRPIRYQQNQLELSLAAQDVQLEFARDQREAPLLVLSAAREGRVELRISHADLQALLLAVAREAGTQQGVTVQDLQLKLTQRAPRSAAAEVRVTAKKLFVSGVVTVHGQVDIGDDLTATLSQLDAHGDGVVGAMAAGLLRGKLQPQEGRSFPLMAFSLGDVALRDLELSVEDGVHVAARFGSRGS